MVCYDGSLSQTQKTCLHVSPILGYYSILNVKAQIKALRLGFNNLKYSLQI
jgi:hypothetical protein